MSNQRRALLVGINDYDLAPLNGCVNDALAMQRLLSKNADGSPNFECKLLTAPGDTVTKAELRKAIEDLLDPMAGIALLYFSGHGTADNLGGFLVTQDAQQYDAGMSMTDVLNLANDSKVPEVVIILDCCYSGAFGQLPNNKNNTVNLREGISVLTASHTTQPSIEIAGSGLFTSLLCAGLEGGAGDVLGKVTVANLYTYVDQSLGAWSQRPLFKAHLRHVTQLRACKPVVELPLLRLIPKYFKAPNEEHGLDPSYEPEAEPKHPDNQEIFGHLQKYRNARLVEPVGEDHMYFAAMNSKSCRLTPLGQHLWTLANEGRL